MKTKHTKAAAPKTAATTLAATKAAATKPISAAAARPATWLTSRVQPKPFPTTATATELTREVRRVLDQCPSREWNELRRARPGRLSGHAPFICG